MNVANLAIPLDVRLMNLTSNLLLWLFALLAAAALAGWAVSHPWLNLRGISVLGDVNHNNAATLRAYVLPRVGGTFLSVDLAAVRQAFESVPWVRRAVVQRDFPNRLRVTLQEHQAVAYWGQEGDPRLLNQWGEVFEANLGEVEQDNLPRLSGPDGESAQVLAMYRAVQPVLAQQLLGVEQFELTDRGSWRAELDNRARLELGRGSPEEVLERTRRFVRTLNQVTSRYGRSVSSLEYADLRHQEGYAIRLRGVSTVTAAPAPPKR